MDNCEQCNATHNGIRTSLLASLVKIMEQVLHEFPQVKERERERYIVREREREREIERESHVTSCCFFFVLCTTITSLHTEMAT